MKTALTQAAAAIALSVCCTLPALADPIVDQIDSARQAYENGDARVAIQGLNIAVSQIEQQLTRQQLKLLPAPLEGWTADEATAQGGGFAAMIVGTNLSRTYRNETSDAEITITITSDSPMLPMLNMMLSAPMLLQADPRSNAYSYQSFNGVLQQGDAGAMQVSLMIGSRILVQIEGTGAEQQELEAYLDAMNLAQLEQALLG